MRSRYSAYATKSADYIYQTYAESSRVHQSICEISEWAKETKWLRLIIHSASENTLVNNENYINYQKGKHNYPTVSFSAYYRHQGSYYLMKETSRFILENNQWHYLDGAVCNNKEIAAPKRNEPCFCQSQRKFKQCCGA